MGHLGWMSTFDPYGRDPSNLALLLRSARENIADWQKELQEKIEKWTRENGYTPADKTAALALIDELKVRGVKSFRGLGIDVTL